MSVTLQFYLLLFCAGAIHVSAQLEVLPAGQRQAVFSGEGRTVGVLFRNAGAQTVEVPLSVRLFQLSSSVVMPAGEAQPWKKLTVLGKQTVVESASLKFPDVRAVTRFQVRWLDDAGKTVGQTLVTVYPTNLLKELAALAGEKPVGLFDPQERITPLLKSLKVEFTDLGQGERLDSFHDRLAILGPFDGAQRMTRDLRKRIHALAERGVSVVLIAAQPQGARVANSPVLLLNGRLVSIAPETIGNIDTSPLAQEALLQCARLALNSNLSLTETEP